MPTILDCESTAQPHTQRTTRTPLVGPKARFLPAPLIRARATAFDQTICSDINRTHKHTHTISLSLALSLSLSLALLLALSLALSLSRSYALFLATLEGSVDNKCKCMRSVGGGLRKLKLPSSLKPQVDTRAALRLRMQARPTLLPL